MSLITINAISHVRSHGAGIGVWPCGVAQQHEPLSDSSVGKQDSSFSVRSQVIRQPNCQHEIRRLGRRPERTRGVLELTIGLEPMTCRLRKDPTLRMLL